MNRRTTACALGAVLVSCGTTNRPTEDGGSPGLTSSSGSNTDSGGTNPGGTDSGGTGTGGGSNSDGSGGGGDTSGGTPKFDVGTPDGGDSDGNGACECVTGEFSYVWVANTDEATVSKINTRTAVEEARYTTGPDIRELPSRTSVSVDGKAVVVANRLGGVVKFWANEADCQDTNGTPGIQTSDGPGNILPFGQDDCMEWYTDFPLATSQRPVQWTPGIWDQSTCTYVDQKVWTVNAGGGVVDSGRCGYQGVSVYRLNGDTGAVEDTIDIPENEFPCEGTLGPYGASVDREGNLWFQKMHEQKLLARVDGVSLAYEIFAFPDQTAIEWSYGIIVDHRDRVWLSGGVRFDYAANQFDYFTVPRLAYTGLALDVARNRIWWSDWAELNWMDLDTMVAGPPIPWPDGGTLIEPRGVSVDVDGFLWAARYVDDVAFKIDPDSAMTWTVTGLNRTYTYSDMTGGQLASVGGCVPPPD